MQNIFKYPLLVGQRHILFYSLKGNNLFCKLHVFPPKVEIHPHTFLRDMKYLGINLTKCIQDLYALITKYNERIKED